MIGVVTCFHQSTGDTLSGRSATPVGGSCARPQAMLQEHDGVRPTTTWRIYIGLSDRRLDRCYAAPPPATG